VSHVYVRKSVRRINRRLINGEKEARLCIWRISSLRYFNHASIRFFIRFKSNIYIIIVLVQFYSISLFSLSFLFFGFAMLILECRRRTILIQTLHPICNFIARTIPNLVTTTSLISFIQLTIIKTAIYIDPCTNFLNATYALSTNVLFSDPTSNVQRAKGRKEKKGRRTKKRNLFLGR